MELSQTEEDMDESGRHKGVLYGISHPGPAFGCPYCTETLRQAEMVARWVGEE